MFTYPLYGDVPQCHLRTIEVEEVHEFDSTAVPQSTVVDATGLVV